jgi:sugar diacid utilization regulator
LQLKSDFEDYMQSHKLLSNIIPGMHRKITCRTNMQQRLIAPIIIQKEVYGYCSFVYIDKEMEHLDEDFLFLDRFANAASVYLLNQKTRFESFERIKGTFLEQIIDNKLTKAEILSRANYAGIDLEKPYFIAAMEYKQPDLAAREQFQLQGRLFETVVHYFNIKKQQKILVSQRDGRMIMLLPAEKINNDTVYSVFREFYLHLKEKFPKEAFYFGISSCNSQIEQASKAYKEALVALSLPLKKTIVEFHKMGILGVLVNSDNREAILSVARQELGQLYSDSDPKNLDLLKTLYTFLINGGKLEQTMKDLSLSMSGLRHRLQKIESVLNKDLRESTTAHQLWMLMNALIAIGELDLQ